MYTNQECEHSKAEGTVLGVRSQGASESVRLLERSPPTRSSADSSRGAQEKQLSPKAHVTQGLAEPQRPHHSNVSERQEAARETVTRSGI